tara:strand:+ start:9790 stop:10620 length:831 start_codon:yes stop_codon:yes gene_type:complete
MLSLPAYLDRIKFSAKPCVDLATLKGLQRQHLLNIPYENLDVQLERTVSRGLDDIFAKLVTRKRGGWCYEMNGLLGWSLEQIGFDVTYLSGGVARSLRGDSALGNHLVILVNLEGQQWIVDTGFGDGFIEPIELKQGRFQQRGFAMQLERLPDGYWRFHNHEFGGAPSFDFLTETADQELLDTQCHWLQTNEDSPFVRALVFQSFNDKGYDIQIGLVAKTVASSGVSTRRMESFAEFENRLATTFNVRDPDLFNLWPKLTQSHALLFPDESPIPNS